MTHWLVPAIILGAIGWVFIIMGVLYGSTSESHLHWNQLKTFHDTHKITFNIIDGVPDPTSIKMEEL
jgi:hypothetical protein